MGGRHIYIYGSGWGLSGLSRKSAFIVGEEKRFLQQKTSNAYINIRMCTQISIWRASGRKSV